MDADLYRRAQAIFDVVVEAGQEQRAGVLKGLCGADSGLAGLVAQLLAADERTSEMDTRTGLGVAGILAREVNLEVMPTTIGHFRVIRELGRGGMGVVYEAQQALPRRRVALKTLPPWRDSPAAVALFHSEIQAMAQVLHPGIPQVYEVLEDGGLPALAMELVEGQPLGTAAAGLSVRRRAGLIEQIADAIQAAHDAGVVHRDLKPSNVLVTASGQPKVLDFGIAALAQSEAGVAGTMAYAAPEQLRGGVVDVRSDIYGLGALAWELLVGGPPISAQGLTLAEALAAKARPPEPPPTLPRALAAIVLRALVFAPEGRYPSARALADDLRRFTQHRPVQALAGDLRHWLTAHARRLAPALALTSVGAALALGLGVAVMTWLQGQAAAANERRADELLAALVASAGRGEVSEAEQGRAFDAFVRDPAQDGTRALPRAWLWRAAGLSGVARRRALASAWTGADVPEDMSAALLALAPILAAEGRWTALAAVLERLPAPLASAQREALALQRWDFAAARATLAPDWGPILDMFASTRTAPAVQGGVLLAGGDLLFDVDGELRRLGADGAVLRRWAVADVDSGYVRDGEAVWLTRHPEGGPRTLLRLDPGRDDPPVVIEQFDAAIMSLEFADLDRDGVRERYTGLGPYLTGLRVAEPPEAASRVLDPATDRLRADVAGLAVADLDGDGAQELVVGSYGWHDHDLRVLRGAPGLATLAGRLRVGVRTLVVLDDPSGVPTVVSAGRPFGAVPLTPGPDVMARAQLGAQGLVLRESREIAARITYLRAGDLDGDGLQELVANSSLGLHVLRQGPDGALIEIVVPQLRMVAIGQVDDDAAAELWVTDEERGWILGAGALKLPQRPLPRPPPPAAAPMVAEGSARRTWERAEGLVSLDLAADAAEVLAVLGDRPGAVGRAALARATTLLAASDRAGAAALARRLITRHEIDVEQVDVALAALMAEHAFAELRTHSEGLAPRWQALVDRVAQRDVVIAGERIDAALDIVAPEAVRLGAREAGVELRAVAGQGELLALPLQWDGEVLELELELDIRELDWGGQLELSLEAGPWRAGVDVGRGGGGPGEGHMLSLGCAFADQRSFDTVPFTVGPRRLRVTWVAARGELRCALDELSIVRLVPTMPPAGELWLRVRAPTTRKNPPLVHVALRRLEVGGVTRVERAGSAAARAYSLGEPTRLREYMAHGTGLQRALAAAALGEAEGLALAELRIDELRTLLRLDAGLWTGPVARLLGPRFAAEWVVAWGIALQYREASGQAAVLEPALARLDLEQPAAAELALIRAEVLLDRGRRAEALLLLEALRERQDTGEAAWLLIARARARAGEREGAREAIAAALRAASAPELTIDRVLEDRELGALAPVGLAPSPALRGGER